MSKFGMNGRTIKAALMGASALLASSVMPASADAAAFDKAAFPATVEASVIPDSAVADNHDPAKSPIAKRAALIAIAAGALTGLISLLGPRRVWRRLKRITKQAANVTSKAAGAAAGAVAKAARSPLRWLAWTAGLVVFALTGVGFYDIEWIGGMIAGVGLASLAAIGLGKFSIRPRLKPIRVQSADYSKQ